MRQVKQNYRNKQDNTGPGRIVHIALGIMMGLALIYFWEVGAADETAPAASGAYLAYAYPVIFLWASYLLHIPIHETGHLVAGKMSGYGFVSIRMLSTVVVKQSGKLRLRRSSLPGTAGGCLMSPPAPVDGEFPYRFYYLGGSAASILAACAAIVPAIFAEQILLRNFLITFIAVGILIGATNLIPMRVSGIDNDGHKTRTLGRSAASRRALWLTLRVAALSTEGRRLRDMPPEWFVLPDWADLSEGMVGAIANLHFCYLIDRMELTRAMEYCHSILSRAGDMPELYKNEMRCELLFLEMVTWRRWEAIAFLYTEQLAGYIRSRGAMADKQRILYAYAKLVSHDEAGAALARAKFEKGCETHPYAGDAESERELIALVDRLAYAPYSY